MSLPFCQSSRKLSPSRPKVRLLLMPIRKLGLLSPMRPTVPVPSGSVSTPTMRVAEESSSNCQVPSVAPKPPCWNGGTSSWVMVERLSENVVRKNHENPWLSNGVRPTAASSPRVRSRPPLKISVWNPDDSGRSRRSSRSFTFF